MFCAVKKTLVCQAPRDFKAGQLASRSAQLEVVTSIFSGAARQSEGTLIKLTTVQGWWGAKHKATSPQGEQKISDVHGDKSRVFFSPLVLQCYFKIICFLNMSYGKKY